MGAVTAPVIMGAAIYLSQRHGGTPSVDDSVCLPAPLGLNPRGDAGLSSGKGVCLGASSRQWDGLGSSWAGLPPSAGETAGDVKRLWGDVVGVTCSEPLCARLSGFWATT